VARFIEKSPPTNSSTRQDLNSKEGESNNYAESRSSNCEKKSQKSDALIIMVAKLKKNKRFNSFFVTMAEDGTISNFCKLSRNLFKTVL